MFRLRFPESRISYWAARCSDPGDALILNRIGPAAGARGYLTRAELLQICEWKAPWTLQEMRAVDRALWQYSNKHQAR